MVDKSHIITLYTELAQNPQKDFGWEKGLVNAQAHCYKKEWIEALPSHIWDYCAAVGNPFNDAEIHKGDTVVDLGCGAGVDVLVSSLLVGKEGKVFGVDITPTMVQKAQLHAKEAGFENVTILEGSFDKLAIEDESVDVVISNGAINLTLNKESVFAEIYRVLKPNCKIYFADMIDISQPTCCSIEQSSCCTSSPDNDWANCVAGTLKESELTTLIEEAGFRDVACTGHTHYSTAETTKGATFMATKIPTETLRRIHWDEVFKKVDYTQVLWHQNLPEKSLEFIQQYALFDAKIIDVGCGASLLVDKLIQKGYKNITLLDTAKTSLEIVKKRVANTPLNYICNDVLDYQADTKYDIWHDRAVFHFLLTRKEQKSYFNTLINSLKVGAFAIISTFRVDGPTQCSGLDIVQYDAKKLQTLLPLELVLESFEEYLHITPKGTDQKYIYFVIKKIS